MSTQTRFALTAPRLTLMIALAAILAAQPWSVRFDHQTGSFAIASGAALADGSDDDHGDDRDDDHDDDRDDDHGSDDDDHGDDHDDGGSDDRDDDRNDDDDDIVIIPDAGDTPAGTVSVRRIELSSEGIEVSYSDGSREEVESGIYERKDPTGRTVEERPATQADLDRLNALR